MTNSKFKLTLDSIHAISPLTKRTRAFLEDNFKTLQLNKNDLVLAEGELTDKLFVIRKGLVRGYRVFEGQEVTFWVSIDSEFFTSANYFLQLPSEEHIECLEDCILDYLTYDHIQYALEHFSDFKAFYLKNFELYYRFAQIRATIARIPNAKSRLDYFFKNYNPKIINRCPDKYLSSFLNVQPETYCRLKKRSFSALQRKKYFFYA